MQTVRRCKNAVTNATNDGNNRNTGNAGNVVQEGSKYNFLTYKVFIVVLSKKRMLGMLFVNYAGNNAANVNASGDLNTAAGANGSANGAATGKLFSVGTRKRVCLLFATSDFCHQLCHSRICCLFLICCYYYLRTFIIVRAYLWLLLSDAEIKKGGIV